MPSVICTRSLHDALPISNLTVLEWLNALPEFRGRVAAFGTWDAFAAILNRERSHMFLRAGWELPEGGRLTPQRKLLADLYRTRSEEHTSELQSPCNLVCRQ